MDHLYFYEDGLIPRMRCPVFSDNYPEKIISIVAWNYTIPLTVNAENFILLSLSNVVKTNTLQLSLAVNKPPTAHLIGSKYFSLESAIRFLDSKFPYHERVFYPHPNPQKNPKKLPEGINSIFSCHGPEIELLNLIGASDIIICGFTSVPIFIKEIGHLNSKYDIPVYLNLEAKEVSKIEFTQTAEINELINLMTKKYKLIFQIDGNSNIVSRADFMHDC